jgi:hypothetical protein
VRKKFGGGDGRRSEGHPPCFCKDVIRLELGGEGCAKDMIPWDLVVEVV